MSKVNCPHPDCDFGVLSNIEHDQVVVDVIAYHYAHANHHSKKDKKDDDK
jgi:hypothetical protein